MSESLILAIGVDHDLFVGISLRLRKCECEVISARSLAEGIGSLNDRQPHVVLIDIELPKPAGLAMLRDCLGFAAPRQIPVISISNSHRMHRRALAAGAAAHVDKPFRTDALAIAVRVALSAAQSPPRGRELPANPMHRDLLARIDQKELKTRGPIVAKCQKVLAASKRKLTSEPTPESPCVLVVDDDTEIRCGIRLRLQAAGYTVLVACNGEQALNIASQCHPDVILLDVHMPCMDGLTVLCKLRERPETADIPVVMLSASIVDQRASLDAGARFFMKKPYQARSLLAALSTAMQH